MALTDTFPTQDAGGLSITDTRLVMAGLVAQNADGTPRPGVLAAGTAPIVTGKASMAYDVAPFKAALSRISGGVELVANDAVTSVATTAAPSANSRLDVIYVRSRFTQHADGSNVPEFGVAQGVAAGIPTKPAIPAGALELATAEITSTTTTTGTAVITQTAPFTATAGGMVPLRSQAEQDAYSAPNGASALRLDLGALRFRVGGQWRANQTSAVLAEWHKNIPGGSAGGQPMGPSGSTFAIAAAPYARSIRVTAMGGVLPSANGNAGVSVAPSTGVWAGGANEHRVNAAPPQFTDLSYVWYMASLPANTALTLTITSQSSVTAGYDLHFTIEEF